VQGLFDDIEYQKGGAVLRMLWNYMSSNDYANSRLPEDVQPGHDDDVSFHHRSSLGNTFMRFQNIYAKGRFRLLVPRSLVSAESTPGGGAVQLYWQAHLACDCTLRMEAAKSSIHAQTTDQASRAVAHLSHVLVRLPALKFTAEQSSEIRLIFFCRRTM